MNDVAQRVRKIIAEHLDVEESAVTDHTRFVDDLGMDSLDTVELVIAFEDEFGVEISDDVAVTILTVKDAIAFNQQNASK